MGKKPAAKAQEEAKKTPATEETKDKAEKVHVEAEPEKKHKAYHASSKSREELSCKIKKCKRSYKAKGYCTFHYKEWRNGKFGMARYKTCGHMECKKPMSLNRHGYCEDHFQAIYVKGTVTTAAPAEEKAPEKKESAA